MTRRESDYVILREHESEVTFFDVLSFRAWMKSILSFTLIFPFLFFFLFSISSPRWNFVFERAERQRLQRLQRDIVNCCLHRRQW